MRMLLLGQVWKRAKSECRSPFSLQVRFTTVQGSATHHDPIAKIPRNFGPRQKPLLDKHLLARRRAQIAELVMRPLRQDGFTSLRERSWGIGGTPEGVITAAAEVPAARWWAARTHAATRSARRRRPAASDRHARAHPRRPRARGGRLLLGATGVTDDVPRACATRARAGRAPSRWSCGRARAPCGASRRATTAPRLRCRPPPPAAFEAARPEEQRGGGRATPREHATTAGGVATLTGGCGGAPPRAPRSGRRPTPRARASRASRRKPWVRSRGCATGCWRTTSGRAGRGRGRSSDLTSTCTLVPGLSAGQRRTSISRKPALVAGHEPVADAPAHHAAGRVEGVLRGAEPQQHERGVRARPRARSPCTGPGSSRAVARYLQYLRASRSRYSGTRASSAPRASELGRPDRATAPRVERRGRSNS